MANTDVQTPELTTNGKSTYSRRVLLAVTGLSPQILTETLYALSVAEGSGERVAVPTEVHLVTTREGANRAILNLLHNKTGWFHKLCRDYSLEKIVFDSDHIHVLTDASGHLLDDIRTPLDNIHAADGITNWVRRFTADADCSLHVSIAGGRKTMGFYAGYALSLYGRKQDRLSHVLVESVYESHPDFYYPTPYSQVIHTFPPDSRPLDTRKAKVCLADIPFVRMRHGLPGDLLSDKARFSDVVAAANRTIGPPELSVDLQGLCIRADGTTISLPPADLAMLAVFARRAVNGQGPLHAPSKDVPDEDWAVRFLAEYRLVRPGEMADRDRTERALNKGMDGDYFSTRKSQLHKVLRNKLGQHRVGAYLIYDGNMRPRRYSLRLLPEQISFRIISSS